MDVLFSLFVKDIWGILRKGILMYNVVLCDDDKRIAAQMEYFFHASTSFIKFQVVATGERLIELVKGGDEFDILVIGNMLKKKNGIMIAKELRSLGVRSDIIFVSGIDCYFYDAFEVEAFRFIKKPLDWNVFKDCIQQAIERINKNNKYFFYKKENVINKIAIEDILYFESSRRMIDIVTVNGTHTYYDRLDTVESYISQKNYGFMRIHKSYLVNSHHVTKYEYSKLHLSNGEFLPISENKRIQIRQTFLDYIDGFVCGITEKAVR